MFLAATKNNPTVTFFLVQYKRKNAKHDTPQKQHSKMYI